MNTSKEIKVRLEYLRTELRAECISTGELIELQSLADYIEDNDVELLEAAGVPEGSRDNKFISITMSIFHDVKCTRAHHPMHEVQISKDLKKARIINPWGGAWGMAKKSAFNNLNTVVQVASGAESYSIYSLRGMGMKVYFKILKKDLVDSK